MLQRSLLIILIIQLCQIVLNKALVAKNVVYAVDCGSYSPSKSIVGFTYQSDSGYSSGKVSDYTINEETKGIDIKYTKDPHIYMTERHDEKTFSYEIPVKSPGKYVLIAKFSELYFSEKKKRVFNIRFGDKIVVSNVDIYEKVRKAAAYDEYIEFELKNDNIYFQDENCPNAFDPTNKKLVVFFEKTQYDNPKVDAIVLYHGTLADTDYSDVPKIREEWEKRAKEERKKLEEERLKKEMAKLKKKEKLKIRNDQFDDLEEYIEEVIDKPEEKSEKPNYYIYIIVGGVIALIAFLKLKPKQTEKSD